MSEQHYMSAAGKAKLAELEGGHMLTAYRDSANVLTIGVGHTGTVNKKPIYDGQKIDRRQSEALFTLDLGRFENTVRKSLKVSIDQRHYEMLVMVAFNIGQGAYNGSTFLRLLNQGASWQKVYASIRQWNKITVNGKKKVSNGLINRRNKEIAWASGKAQMPIRDKVAIGAGTGSTAVVALDQAVSGNDTDTVDTLINSVGIFGMSGSTVLATIGSIVVIGAVGFLIYRKLSNARGTGTE